MKTRHPKRTILTLLPMAMLAMASPTRPLQITSRRHNHRSTPHPRTENKLRHVVPSDTFEGERSNIYYGPLERGQSFHTLYGGVTIDRGMKRRNRLQRNLVEWVVRTVEFRNRFQSNSRTSLSSSHSFVDRNTRTRSNGWTGRKRTRLLRPLVNWFDRSDKMVAMETMDAMDVMGGDMSEMEYSRAMTVVTSPVEEELTSVKVRSNKKRKWNLFRVNLFKEKSVQSAVMSRGGAMTTAAAAAPSSTFKSTAKSTSIASASTTLTTSQPAISSTDTWVIETPLFPIILPKSWEPPTTTSSPQATATTEVLEISISLEEQQQEDAALSKPSLSTIQTATQPLIPKEAWASFQGNEFYHPESMELLSQTGLRMALGPTIDWVGEKKTEKFLQEYGSGSSLTSALLSTQEVLAWSGKFSSEGQGSELPLIKTRAVIEKPPEYLAELLMDSSKVQVYNKMSLGRSDEEVFQSGVNTVGGAFGDGESKIVRNLTKPPMVNNLLEFVTCMHARKLRADDSNWIQSTNNESTEGYIVVSRAVTGGKWDPIHSNNSGEKYVRNEILLGVNVLRAIPGEPDKTELTAVTHVYSPLVPLMLAKSAGMKGAVDFVRDMRAIP